MTTEGWTVLALVLLPVVAVISLGFLARAFVEAGGNHWPLWLVVLVLSGVVWFYVITDTP